jgi:hypothetical protein
MNKIMIVYFIFNELPFLMSFFHPTLSFHPFFFQSTAIIAVSVSLEFYKKSLVRKKQRI